MFIHYFLTVLTAVFVALSALGKKYSNARSTREKMLNIGVFSAIVAFCMWAAFFFSGEKIALTVVLYGAVFAVNFVICNYALYAAMEYGSLSKTNLVNALSLVIPTSAGIIFWQEKYNPWLFFSALALMTVSLLLIVLNRGEARAEHRGKWLIFNSIAFLTNGLSSVIQKSEQTAMGGAGVFSMTALSFSFVALFALAVYIPAACAKRSFGSDFLSLKNNKKSLLFNAAGVGIVNLFVTYLSTRVTGAFLYPCVLGGSVIVAAVFSAVFFKEKLSLKAAVGIAAGVAAIVLFSL